MDSVRPSSRMEAPPCTCTYRPCVECGKSVPTKPSQPTAVSMQSGGCHRLSRVTLWWVWCETRRGLRWRGSSMALHVEVVTAPTCWLAHFGPGFTCSTIGCLVADGLYPTGAPRRTVPTKATQHTVCVRNKTCGTQKRTPAGCCWWCCCTGCRRRACWSPCRGEPPNLLAALAEACPTVFHWSHCREKGDRGVPSICM